MGLGLMRTVQGPGGGCCRIVSLNLSASWKGNRGITYIIMCED
jgi:hypothetical protein